MSEDPTKPPLLDYALQQRTWWQRWRVALYIVAGVIAVPLILEGVEYCRWRMTYTGARCSVVLQAVDSSTGQSVPITVGSPWKGANGRPLNISCGSGGDRSKMVIGWDDVDVVPLRVKSDGYIEQVIWVSRKSPSQIAVRFTRAGPSKP